MAQPQPPSPAELRKTATQFIQSLRERTEKKIRSYRNHFLAQLGFHAVIFVAGVLANVTVKVNPWTVGGTLVLGGTAFGANFDRLRSDVDQYFHDSQTLRDLPDDLDGRLALCTDNDVTCLQNVIALCGKTLDALKGFEGTSGTGKPNSA